MIVRLALASGLLVVGLGTGLASVALHDKSWAWFALAVVTPLLTVLAVPGGLLRGGFALGWLAVLGLAVLGRPEGDAALASTSRGYGLFGAGLLVMTVAIATLPRPVRRSP